MFFHDNWSVLTVNFLAVFCLALAGIALRAVPHLISAAVTAAGFLLVRRAMRRNHLIKI